MENKEISAKRQSSMRRNSFEQTLPSEVREILDTIMPRTDLERAAVASSAVPTLSLPKQSEAAPAAESAAAATTKESFGGMVWGGDEMTSRQPAPAPKPSATAGIPVLQPDPKPEPKPAPAPVPTPTYPTRPAPTPRLTGESAAAATSASTPPMTSEPKPSKLMPKIVVGAVAAVAVVVCCAVFLGSRGDKDESSNRTLESETVTSVTTTVTDAETTLLSVTTTAEATEAAETTVTSDTATETTVSTDSTAESSDIESNVDTTVSETQVEEIFSYEVKNLDANNKPEYWISNYEWINPSNPAEGLKSVTLHLVLIKTSNLHPDQPSSNNFELTIRNDGGAMVCPDEDRYVDETRVLKQNVQPILQAMFNSDNLIQSDFFNNNLAKTYWNEGTVKYDNWVKNAQVYTISAINYVLNNASYGHSKSIRDELNPPQ